MSKIEDLVPPLELCKLIPKGKFDDSLLRWYEFNRRDREVQFRQSIGVCCGAYFPAPTLQEILMGIEDSGLYCPTCYHQGNRWAVDCEDDAVDEDANNLPCLYDAEDYDNPATAALRLWFKVNGIEVKK